MAKFVELFAGGGMARLGLGDGWQCVIANDFCMRKAASYTENFGAEHFHLGDIGQIRGADIPDAALWWGSSPCQDLSEAGARKGLAGERSGAIRHVWRLLWEKRAEGLALPKIVCLENVTGLMAADGGGAIKAIEQSFKEIGYGLHIYEIDAIHFVPQSRPRIFIVAALGVACFPKLPPLPRRNTSLSEILEDGAEWEAIKLTQGMLARMAPAHLTRVAESPVAAMSYRTRNIDGVKTPRWEVREDDAANCLRTGAGGSSVQKIMRAGRSRKITPREAARLMGLPDSYKLPAAKTDAHTLAGDGVCVPVVRWLSANVLEPLLSAGEPGPRSC